MEDSKKDERVAETARKYNIDLKQLEKEQEKLAKNLEIKDSIDFSSVEKIGGCSNTFFQNKIISAIVVLDSEMNLIEQKYFSDKARFPYIPGFRAYRELPAMTSCFQQLDEKPEVMFIEGHGIAHPRLGIASHFSLAAGVPSIGVTDSLFTGEIEKENIKIDGKIAGKVVKTKEGSRPLYVSPGNLISIKSAAELVKRFTKEGKKLPEPLRIAGKYAKEVVGEVFKT